MKLLQKLREMWSDPDGTVAMVRRVFSESFKDHVGLYVFALICMVIASGATAASAWLMRSVVNDIFVSQNAAMIGVLSLAVIAISVAKGFATYGQTVSLGRIGNAVTANYQRRIMDKLLTLGVDFFSSMHSSKFIMRMSHNARAAQSVVMMVSTSLGRDLLTVLALYGVMVAQDPVMSLAALAVAPPVIFGVAGIVRKVKALAGEEFLAFAAVVKATQETVQGIRIVKAFTLEEPMRGRANVAVAGAEARANKINSIMATSSPLMESLGGISIGLLILYAGWQTTTAGKTPGEFMAFMVAFLLAYEPAKRLARLNIALQRSLRGVRIMYDILDRPGQEEDPPDAIALEGVKGHVAIRDVNFGYKKKTQVLHDVTLEAAPGEVVALVGPSGAGKTTIVSLLQRFYEPWSGSIEIDGKDISGVTFESLRRNISMVSQDTFLFSGTVYENIELGRPGASAEEVYAAAEAAYASEFITALDDGFQSDVGENGVTLSGGQRQRIAIARAVLRQAPILLLDEATSALDTESERQIRMAIERLMRGRTTFVIAHRLSTIAAADKTYVLDEGRVVEHGSHDNLLGENRLYSRLFGPDGQGGEPDDDSADDRQIAK